MHDVIYYVADNTNSVSLLLLVQVRWWGKSLGQLLKRNQRLVFAITGAQTPQA